jgi:hypothetical protein
VSRKKSCNRVVTVEPTSITVTTCRRWQAERQPLVLLVMAADRDCGIRTGF